VVKFAKTFIGSLNVKFQNPGWTKIPRVPLPTHMTATREALW